MNTNRGFTLFEVAISLMIVTFGVISVMMLIPSGIKAQQFARFQILASARAMELVDGFSTSNGGYELTDREGPYPWDVNASYRAYSPDLETAMASGRYGLMPLPVDIAKRLDSDGDEIQQILNEGGYIYYSNPLATATINQNAVANLIPLANETGKMICAVSGFAQQNAIPAFSYKDWPYYAPYPSPPMHIEAGASLKTSLPQAPYSVLAPEVGAPILLWENCLEADQGEMGLVFRAVVKGNDSNLPGTTKWIKASEPGGILENAKNHLGKLYFRDSGYLACCDQYGWIPTSYLMNLASSYNSNRGPSRADRWQPNTYKPNWEWRQNGADTSKGIPSYQGVADPGTNDQLYYATQDVIDNKQPLKLQDYGKPLTDPSAFFDNPVAGFSNKDLAKESALAYFALALWYAQEKGVSASIRDGVPLADDAMLLKPSTLYVSSSANTSPALAVNAARILAHAAMVLSNHFDGNSNGSFSLDACEIYREGTYPFDVKHATTSNGIPASPTVRPPLTRISAGTPKISTDMTPAFANVDLTKIKIYHDNALRLAMRFAATFPNDWGSPRPMNRSIMMDAPLLQYDMFETSRITTTSVVTPFSFYNYGVRPTSTRYGYTSTQTPAQWRVATAQPIVNVGRSLSYPSMDLNNMWPGIATNQNAVDAAGVPNHKHFTLARPFTAAQRTRELVFWAVDWQSYEDFESAPSAPVDASRHPRLAPWESSNTSSNYGKLSGSVSNPSWNIRQGNNRFHCPTQWGTRNPEKVLNFIGPTDLLPTNSLMYIAGVDHSLVQDNSTKPDHPLYTAFFNTNQMAGLTPLPPKAPAMVFSGQYGADRNANNLQMLTNQDGSGRIYGFMGRLDRGPVPRSVRMRASLIARFNFYDPRLPLVIR